jgi:hypothetical protein
MQSEAVSPKAYIEHLPEERKAAITKLRNVIKKNLPVGFEEKMAYGMVTYVVPHSVYPPGYHCDPKLALPFLSFASQKNFVAVYHMGLYADPDLLKWFIESYPRYSTTKLDMGKSCIRFKKPEQIPFELIGELVSKMSVNDWISLYEKNLKK